MRVLLDANALMAPVESGVRLFEEIDRVVGPAELAVPAAVVEELERLADGGGQEGKAASVAADLVERCTVVEHEAETGDAAIRELAPAYEYVVTNDAQLRERLREAGVTVLGVRGRTTLAVFEPMEA